MAHPEGMQTLAARLASFELPKSKGKKRTSTKNKQAASGWPLESPAVQDLAQAGFYFTATASSPDNVTCFHCQKSLDEWEEGDNPYQEHLQFAPECAWAVTMAVERGIIPKDDEHDPLSEDFVEMRTATFGSSWPHENKKGWTCKIKKLVEAGWHYNPTPEEDDQTKCAYCSLCISCWEPKDKPVEEHKKRSPECSFFRLSSLHKKTRKTRKGRASKASRASTTSIFTATQEPSAIIDEEMNIDDSIMTTATDFTVASTATAAAKRSTRAKKSTAKSTRAKKKVEEEITEDFEESEALEYVEPEAKTDSPVQQKPRGKKRSSTVVLEDEKEEEEAGPARKRAIRGRGVAKQVNSDADVSLDIDEEETGAEAPPANNIEPVTLPENDASIQEISMTDTAEAFEMPKRGAKGRAVRGSNASRTGSGSTIRKVSNTRKASARKASASVLSEAQLSPPSPPALDMDSDAVIEAQLEADLDKPLSDEEVPDIPMEEQTQPDEQTRQQESTTESSAKPAPRRVSQQKPVAEAISLQQEDLEEDELAQMEVLPKQTKPAAETASANHHIKDDDLSGHESDVNSTKKPATKKAAKKASVAAQPKPKRGRPPKKIAPEIEEREPKAEQKPEVETEVESKIQPVSQADESVLETQYPEPPEARFSSSFEEMPSMLEEIKTVKAVQERSPVPEAKPKKVGRPAKAPAATKKGKGKKASAVLTQAEPPMEEIEVQKPVVKEPSPVPSLPVREDTPERQAPPTPATGPGAFPSPTPSPQSSNAENEPPSSRPSGSRPPLSALTPNKTVARVPLGSAGPSTPTHSVRKTEDGESSTPPWALHSAFPWRPIDIENVFAPSPESKRLKWFAPGQGPDGKRNSLPLQASRDVGKMATSAAAREKQDRTVAMQTMLTSPEKKMTVEEWIRWNAERAEQKLRDECERVVGKFESEGIRAMKALEGLTVDEWA